MRTYLWLYLMAPAINSFSAKSPVHLYYIIVISGSISLYMGLADGLDPSLYGGNNIINFLFIYSLGRLLHNKQEWKKIPDSKLITLYLVYNIFLFTIFYFTKRSFLGDVVYKLSFPYDSIGLLLNSLLLFMLFGKIQIRSTTINTIATSTFAMYLFHHNPIILYKIIKPLTIYLDTALGGAISLFFALVLLTVAIMMVTIAVDCFIRPTTKFLENMVSSSIEHLSHNVFLKDGFGK